MFDIGAVRRALNLDDLHVVLELMANILVDLGVRELFEIFCEFEDILFFRYLFIHSFDV